MNTNPINQEFQEAVGAHHNAQFGDKSLASRGMKLGEECGEVLGALVRHEEQRDGRDWIHEVRSELGDVLIVMLQICHKTGISFEDLANEFVRKFLVRTWPNVEKVVESATPKFRLAGLGDFSWKEVYDYYDGPRLGVVSDSTGRLFVALSLPSEAEDLERWLYCPVSDERLALLLGGTLDMRDGILTVEEGLVWEVFIGTGTESIVFRKPETLKEADLPQANAFLTGTGGAGS